MKKNVYMGILTVVTIACILIGSMIHLTDLFSFRTDFSGGDREGSGSSSEKAVIREDIGEFQSIDVEIDLASLTITTGDSYQVSWDYPNDTEPTATVDNGVLTIRQKQKNKISITSLHLLNHEHKADLTITVPAGTELNDIMVKADLADIALTGLTAKTCNVSADMAGIKLSGLKIPSISVSFDTGEADIKTSEFTFLSVDSDVGDIDIDTVDDLAGYSLDLKTDLGTIEVGEQEAGRSYHAAGNGGRSISVRTDTGEIDIY